MSADDQGGAGRREVAYRVFAAEYDDADVSYSESDDDRAPNYVILPTGARVNRVFVVGVLTEVEQASDDVLRARVVDPTGAFVVYAGQYQPDALAFLERADPPTFVAVTGKARTFQPEDSDVTFTSIRPEGINEVDGETRDRWTVQTARQTIDRVRTTARALDYDERGEDLRDRLAEEGVDVGLSAGIPLALDHYGTTATYLDAVNSMAIQAAEVVADKLDEAASLTIDPDTGGGVDPRELAAQPLDAAAPMGVSSDVSTADASTGDATSADASTGDATSADASTGDIDETGSATGGEQIDEPEQVSTASTEETEQTSSKSQSRAKKTGAVGDSGQSERLDSSEAGDARDIAAETEPDTATESEPETEPDAATAGDTEELEDFEPGEFELDENEREQIESEYGTEFQSGTEVDEPGEANIDTPDPEPAAAESGSVESSPDAETEPERVEPGAVEQSEPIEQSEPTEVSSAEGSEDVDLEAAVMDAMEATDDGTGAAEDEIVTAVVEQYGIDEEEVADAIQDALMDGRCYEPDDGVYKPI